MRETSTHVYFFRDKDYLSNFYPCFFTVKGVVYSCSEQYIMHQKALLFKDMESAENILKEKKPYAIKKLGRKVKHFQDQVWRQHRDKILYDALWAKFTQNHNLLLPFIKTCTKTLVEASPYDKIYGVGLSEKDDAILDENNWKGSNLLGYTLMKVRHDIFSKYVPGYQKKLAVKTKGN